MPFTPDQVLFLDADNIYGADELGLPYRDIISEGVVEAGFAVAQRAAGANMSVDVAAGAAWIRGDDNPTLQPTYRYREAATTNLVIATADPTNPRIDIVIAEIRDSTFAGVNKDGRLRVITGTPAGSPVAPATPGNAIKLAEVSVPANDTTIENAQITDKRPSATVGGLLGVTAPAWQSYTPALTGSVGNPTLGTGGTVQTGRFFQFGKLVVVSFLIRAGSSGFVNGSGDVRLGLPVPSAAAASSGVGSGVYVDVSATGTYALAAIQGVSNTFAIFRYDQVAASFTLTYASPVTWAVSDEIQGILMYEAA